MEPIPSGRTLYEDWQARWEHLQSAAHGAGSYDALERQLLEFLLERYRDSPEGARPARFPLRAELYVNQRALVVFQHLAEGQFPTMSNARETRDHVKSVLERMAEQPADRGEEDRLRLSQAGDDSSNERSMDALRMKLCDGDPVARVRAVVELGETGSLDDVGLLSDLLALPFSRDEHPWERVATAHALKRLAGMTSKKFNLRGVESA